MPLKSEYPFLPIHTLQLTIQGDEGNNWEETPDGYAVVSVPTGFGKQMRYMYGKVDPTTRLLVPTALEVGKADPKAYGLSKNQRPAPKNNKFRRDAFHVAERRSSRMFASRKALIDIDV